MEIRFFQKPGEVTRHDELRAKYYPRITAVWDDVPFFGNAADIPADAKAVHLKRVKKSHAGIADCAALEGLYAEATDQAFVDEIGQLEGLQFLELAWPTTAKTLEPLAKLQALRVLKIDSPRNIEDFTPLTKLERLETLVIENAKHLETLDWLAPLAPGLKAFGIEGSMNTTQRIESLAPLAGFDLEALFLTSTRLADQDLSPLHGMDNLKLLQTAIVAPRRDFEALNAAIPDCECTWFEPENWKDFRDPPKPKKRR